MALCGTGSQLARTCMKTGKLAKSSLHICDESRRGKSWKEVASETGDRILKLEDDVNRYSDINDRQGSLRFGR